MGYMGLKDVGDSDMAMDLVFDLEDAIAKVLRKGLKEKGNEWNTGGAENVALVFEAFVKPVVSAYKAQRMDGTDLPVVVKETADKLNKLITKTRKQDKEEWPSGESYDEHLKAYCRMRDNIRRFLRDTRSY